MRRARIYIGIPLLLALVACAGPKLAVEKTSYDALPGWDYAQHSEALQTFRRSCDAMAQRGPGEQLGKGMLAAAAIVWQDVCSQAMHANDATSREYFETYFTPMQASDRGNEEGLFTGYYEPLLRGSLKKHGPYRHPVYALPPDLEEGVPYYTREEIENGALRGRRLEIAYVDDAVMLFFLHIQGSGRIRLDTGGEMLIGYAGKNNRSYVTLGKVMLDEGLLEKGDVSMFSIRDWLRRHPRDAHEMMNRNPSYVFFRKLDSNAVKGAQGVELTPLRSLAVDWRFIPYGMPVYLQAELPDTPLSASQEFNRLMIAQDTGGAIRGPVRGDVFFGAGPRAEAWAGYMKSKGRYTLLVPNALANGL